MFIQYYVDVMKICTKCKIEKDLVKFPKNKNTKSGLGSWCFTCCKEKDLNWCKNNSIKRISYNKEWQNQNKEKIKNYQLTYKNKDAENKKVKNNLRAKKYRENNKDIIKARVQNKIKTNLNFKLGITLRNRIRDAIKNQSTIKAASSIELLGTSIVEVRQYLESLFQNGMTWQNHGEWHIDHIIPVSHFDLTQIEEQKKCFHYTNLQPLWAIDNLKKGNR